MTDKFDTDRYFDENGQLRGTSVPAQGVGETATTDKFDTDKYFDENGQLRGTPVPDEPTEPQLLAPIKLKLLNKDLDPKTIMPLVGSEDDLFKKILPLIDNMHKFLNPEPPIADTPPEVTPEISLSD